MVMELIFSRLLSLLAYHPDYPSDELDESTKLGDLSDFAQYIIYYLSAVANEHNMSLIFHVAQRVKQFRDGITKSDEISTRLHTLSDLAQATIRRFADIYSQQHKFGGGSSGATNLLQTYPGKMGVPSSLFASMTSHREAQDVADKNFLPDEIDDLLDRVVRAAMKPRNASHGAQSGFVKKRKPEASDANGTASKKARKEKSFGRPRKSTSSVGVLGKSSRRKRTGDDEWPSDVGSEDDKPKSTSARRRSSRGTGKQGVSYADRDSDEDDQEMQKWEEAQENEVKDDENDEEEEVQDSDEEMPDEDDENDDQDEENAEDASEKENSPPVPPKRGAKAKANAKASGSKTNTPAKQPTTSTLPTRRSSRRG
jgi:sister-chromatid-cohesion protein PDS5